MNPIQFVTATRQLPNVNLLIIKLSSFPGANPPYYVLLHVTNTKTWDTVADSDVHSVKNFQFFPTLVPYIGFFSLKSWIRFFYPHVSLSFSPFRSKSILKRSLSSLFPHTGSLNSQYPTSFLHGAYHYLYNHLVCVCVCVHVYVCVFSSTARL